MLELHCPLCGSTDIEEERELQHFVCYYCNNCGIGFTNYDPIVTKDNPFSVYEEIPINRDLSKAKEVQF